MHVRTLVLKVKTGLVKSPRRRGVSEVVGSILLIVLTVAIVALLAYFVAQIISKCTVFTGNIVNITVKSINNTLNNITKIVAN